MNSKNLHVRIIYGSFWNFIEKISTSSLSLLKLIIVAIIISPGNYGLLTLAILTMSFTDTFTQIGFKQSLIQDNDNIESYLNTAWTISILRGLILYLTLFFLAPLVAFFFEESELDLIIRIISLNIIIQGFINTGIIYFEKELNFRKNFLLNCSNELPAFIFTILFLFYLKSLWAWIIGSLIGSIIYLITSHFIHPYRPKFEIKKHKITKMFNFGKWLLINNIIIFFLIQGDDLFVGKFLGVIILGFYSLAYKISNLVTTEISHVITSVAFPSFSIIQNEKESLKQLYLDILQIVSFFVFPMSGLIFILASNFTHSILGINWIPIIPLIMILVIEGLIRALSSTLGSLSQGIGFPNIITKVSLIQLVIFVALIYPMSSIFGVIGVALLVVLHFTISLPILLKICLPKIGLHILDWMKSILFPMLSTLLMCFILYPIANFFDYNVHSLLIEFLLGIAIYLIFGLICLKLNILQSKKILEKLLFIKSTLINFTNKRTYDRSLEE